MAKATEAALSRLHGVVAEELTRRIQESEATAADLGAAIKFLKDNHITASIEDNQALSDLKQKLNERLAKRPALTLVPHPSTSQPSSDDVEDVLDSIAYSASQQVA